MSFFQTCLSIIVAVMLVVGGSPVVAQTTLPPGSWRVANGDGHGHGQAAQPATKQMRNKGPAPIQPHSIKELGYKPLRVTMEQLHQMGGVPKGWGFTLPVGDADAGRKAFVDLGCQQCHLVSDGDIPKVEGTAEKPGPDLGGMGGHHSAEYFAESILTPNRIIILGPGYTGDDGLSIMPGYVDSISVRQLVDIVSLLKNLKGHTSSSSHKMEMHHGK